MAIQLGSSFFVPAGIEEAWAVLNDVERVASCVPGAELIEVGGDNIHKGRIAVRLGPVLMQFGGTVEFRERDAVRHHAVISATGNELKGRGNAHALLVCDLRPEDRGTRVDVKTVLDLAGQVAQCGRGTAMIESVAQQVVKQFADSLAASMRVAQGAALADSRPTEIRLGSLVARAWWQVLVDRLRKVFSGKS
jgi:carbon monoxide dehydrogenase subunit G